MKVGDLERTTCRLENNTKMDVTEAQDVKV